MNITKSTIVIAVALLMALAAGPSAFGTPVTSTISVQPSSLSIVAGSTVTLDVNIANVTDLFGFQFDLNFTPGTLSAVSMTEGFFLPSGGPTLFLPGTIDNTAGTIAFNADTLFGPGSGVSGSGTLAILTLSGLKVGTGAIDLSNVLLLDSKLHLISSNVHNGKVAVIPAGVTPEPSTMLLFVTGLIAMGFKRRNYIKQQLQ